MTFSFTVAGDKKQAVAQLREIADGKRTVGSGSLGPDLARLLAEHVNQDRTGQLGEYGSYAYEYVITASGHSGGGSPANLKCDLQAHWIVPAEEVIEEIVEAAAAAEEEDVTGAG